MKLKYLLYALLFLAFNNCDGQRANYWAFEPYFGLNFKNDPDLKDTSVILNSRFLARTINTLFYSTRTGHDFSVCDKKGDLLFYSNGVYLRDKNHQLVDTNVLLNMNNKLNVNLDGAANVLGFRDNNIVCTINDSLFYIFSIFKNQTVLYDNSSRYSELRFCAIGIVNNIPKVLIRDSVINYVGAPENISSVKVNEGEYWLIIRDTAYYASIKVKKNSISNPNYFPFLEERNSINNFFSPASIMVSFDKSKIYSAYSVRWSPNVITPYADSSEFRIYSYRFDKLTGTISSQKLIDYEFNYKFRKQPICLYGSPDSRSVYLGILREVDQPGAFAPTYYMEQLLIMGDTINSRASKIFSRTDQNKVPRGMQLGYNGKLYFANRMDLGIISQPDSFPSFPYLTIKENYLYNINTLAAFSGLDFDYHKLAFKLNNSNCKVPFLQNISDTQFYKKFVWYINETDSFSSFNLPLSNLGYGKFWVRLKGTNNDDFYSNYTDSITIIPPPTARFGVSSLQGCQYVAFNFIDSSFATIGINDSVSCYWDFGDGTKFQYNKFRNDKGRVVKHTYTTNGIYTVKLIIENGYCSDTFTYFNNVNILAAPKPGFTVTAANWCDNPVVVTINTNSIINVVRSFYDMGNNDTISTTNQSVKYTYYKAGQYTIRQKLLGTTGCITQDSFTITIKIGLSKRDTVNVLYTTVLDDNSTKTIWNPLPFAINYKINSKVISDTFYFDKSATPNTQSISYFIAGIDSCGNSSAVAPVAQTIYLKATNTNFNEFALLEYTPYETWKQGVLQYRIEYYDEPTGQWVPIDTVLSSFLKFQANVLASNNNILNQGAEICYRIIAEETNGNAQNSTSNIACVPIYPVVFIPNAFSPNADGINDYFKPVTAGLNGYIFEIYDRWGTLVYSDTPESKGWDGTFKGEPVEAGTYVYRLPAASYLKSQATNDARIVERKGSLYLVR